MKDSLLLIDIGNTAMDVLFLGKEKKSYKVLLGENEMVDEIISSLGKEHPKTYISSVNSKGLKEIIPILEKNCLFYHLLSPEIMKNFALKHDYDIPNTDYLGADLFCDVIAYESSTGIIIVDLGTASKIIYLDEKKKFYGCLIAPGITLFPKTLNVSTDLLKENQVLNNPPLVSLKTEECISSGAVNGTAAMIVTMVKEIKKKYHCSDALVLLTGGNACYVKDLLSDFGLNDVIYDPLVVLKGLARSFELKME